MKLLLDTHTFLWLADGNPKLSPTASTALTDPANKLFLSVASVWELAIKAGQKGQLAIIRPVDSYVTRWMQAYQIQDVPITLPHAFQLADLPGHHRDPFDRLLIAQAIVEGMTLVSVDGKFAAYPVPILW